MIDIFAILLIFVIVTTTFKVPTPEQPAVTIKLPESSSAAGTEGKGQTVISVEKTEEGERVFLDAKPVSLEDLSKDVRARLQQSPPPAFAMRADERISYGYLVKVLDALKEGGVKGSLSAFTQAKK